MSKRVLAYLFLLPFALFMLISIVALFIKAPTAVLVIGSFFVCGIFGIAGIELLAEAQKEEKERALEKKD